MTLVLPCSHHMPLYSICHPLFWAKFKGFLKSEFHFTLQASCLVQKKAYPLELGYFWPVYYRSNDNYLIHSKCGFHGQHIPSLSVSCILSNMGCSPEVSCQYECQYEYDHEPWKERTAVLQDGGDTLSSGEDTFALPWPPSFFTCKINVSSFMPNNA